MTLAVLRPSDYTGFGTSGGMAWRSSPDGKWLVAVSSPIEHSKTIYNWSIVTSRSTPLSREYIENLDRLSDIGKLENNWNNNGAPSFSKNHIDTMKQIISKLHYQPFITPTAKGTIQFEFEDQKGNYLEFELYPDKRIKMFSYSANGEAKTEYIAIEEVREKVDAFHR